MLSAPQPKPSFTDKDALSEQSKQALANLALEGIAPSSELLADMRLLDSGKITREQFRARAIARAKK